MSPVSLDAILSLHHPLLEAGGAFAQFRMLMADYLVELDALAILVDRCPWRRSFP